MTAGRLIAVDIGNTSTKLGWFDDALSSSAPLSLPTLTATHLFSTGEAPPAEIAAALPVENCRWHIVSVHREATHLLTEWLRINRPADKIQVLTHRDLPIEVQVDFPERVGLDRLAAAVAANVLRDANRPAIVIGAGSAITVNLITGHGAFAGGAILPGFRMAAEVLYGSTDLLPLAPLATDEEPPPVVGKNTEAAIKSGLFWGAAGAVREIMDRMAAQLDPPPQVLVTGGDLRQLAKHLGDEATFVPNLVLCGIAIADRKHRSC
jgi:type III pantothenate kinase